MQVNSQKKKQHIPFWNYSVAFLKEIGALLPTNHTTTTTFFKLTEIIIHSKYFPNSDWLRAHA